MTPILVDSNILIDVSTANSIWYTWSAQHLQHAIDAGVAVINPLIYAEVSIHYADVQELDRLIPPDEVERLTLPWEAAFPAGKAFKQYRDRGGTKTSPLPDFYIGAHALVSGLRLLTRDTRRFRTYFPQVELIAPA